MVAIALLLGITVAGLCSLAIANRRGKWAVGGLACMLALSIFCAPILASPFLFFQAVLLFLIVGIGLWFPNRPQIVIGACWFASAGVFALSCYVGYLQVRQLHQWRKQYPQVSLADRLSYERRDSAARAAHPDLGTKPSPPIVLAAAVEQQLASDESEFGFVYRTDLLESLHDEQYEVFIASTGFGIGRMMRVREEGLKLREERVPPDREAADPYFALDGLKSEQPLPLEEEIEPAAGSGAPDRDHLCFVADSSRQDFLNPERFGFAEDGKVSGFVSHRVVYFPGLPGSDVTEEPWAVSRLELVSLLKFPLPAVYLSEDLPDMERLANVPTRPLNAFESEALPKLQTDEDLVVRYAANTIRMLGSLRAGKTCLECHSVPRGALLGAFSYELRRSNPIPVPAARLPAKPKPEA